MHGRREGRNDEEAHDRDRAVEQRALELTASGAHWLAAVSQAIAELAGEGDGGGAVDPGRTSRTVGLAPGARSTAAPPIFRQVDGGTERPAAPELAELGEGGEPLPSPLRDQLAAALGYDLDAVRVHTGATADRAARALGARAFAVGQTIGFRAGAFDPSSPAGVHLIAHEVAHTTQAAGAGERGRISRPDDDAERAADAFADRFVADRSEAGDGHAAGPEPAPQAPLPAGREAPIRRAAEGGAGADDAAVAAFDVELTAKLPGFQRELEAELAARNATANPYTGPWLHVKGLRIQAWDSAKEAAQRPRWIFVDVEVRANTVAIAPIEHRQVVSTVLLGLTADGEIWPASQHGPDAIEAVSGPLEHLIEVVTLIGLLRAIGRVALARVMVELARRRLAREVPVITLGRRGGKAIESRLGKPLVERLAETIDNRQIRKLARDLGKDTLQRLAGELSGKELAELIARTSKDAVKAMAKDLGGAEIRELAATLPDDVIRGLAGPLRGKGLQRLARLDLFKGKFDAKLAGALEDGRGAAARALPPLEGSSAQEVRLELSRRGFTWHHTRDGDGMVYWTHPDGSLIRFKPQGSKVGAQVGRPHITKEILKAGKSNVEDTDAVFAKLSDAGEVIPTGTGMAEENLAQFFKQVAGRRPTAAERGAMMKVWGSSGHIGIEP